MKALDIGLDTNFSDVTPEAWAMEVKINKRDSIKLKSLGAGEKIINKMKRQPIEWEKMFANSISAKELISKVYKNLIQFNSKTQMTSLKHGHKTWIDFSTKKTHKRLASV